MEYHGVYYKTIRSYFMIYLIGAAGTGDRDRGPVRDRGMCGACIAS